MHIDTYGVLVVVISFALTWRFAHCVNGMNSRRCTCGSIWVVRQYHMWQVSEKIFRTQTNTRCLHCDMIRTLKFEHFREFSTWALWWRRLFYRWQFVNGESRNLEEFQNSNKTVQALYMIFATKHEQRLRKFEAMAKSAPPPPAECHSSGMSASHTIVPRDKFLKMTRV